MADRSQVVAALIAKLDGDATLLGFIPADLPNSGCAFKDVAPNGVDKAVIVTKVDHEVVYQHGSIAYERFLMLVKAVHKSSDSTTVDQAAARIDALLFDQPLTITGYTHMITLRDEDDGMVSYAEIDDDTDERWQHAGARYDIWAAPN